MIEFTNALSEGEFPVRFAKRINHGLGYPYFNFNYPFIYYASAGMHSIGVSFVNSFKAILILSVFLGSLGMYLFCRKYFSITAALTGAIFYTLVPYRFLNLYVRGSVAEAFALGLLPFLFLSIDFLVEKKRYSLIFFILILSVLITSHNITVFFAAPFLALYFILRILRRDQKKQSVIHFILGFVLALLLTSFFWFPALFEASSTKLSELTEDYRAFFPSLSEIIYSPWGFGAYVQGDVPGKMSPQIGVVHVLIAIVAFFALAVRFLKKQLQDTDYLFLGFITVAIISFFLLFPTALPLWDNAFYLKLVQHPWRLVGYIVMSTSIAAAYFINTIKNKKAAFFIFIILVIALLYTTRNMVRVNQYVDFHNPFEKSQVYGPSTTSKDEHMPRYAPRIYEDPNPNGDLIASTSGIAKRIVWKTTYHKFILNLKNAASFRDNTSYFPGWRGYVDGREVPLQYANDEFYRLRVTVPKGHHTVEFRYSEVWYRLIADSVSVIAFICVVMVSLGLWIQRRKNLKMSRGKYKTARNARRTR